MEDLPVAPEVFSPSLIIILSYKKVQKYVKSLPSLVHCTSVFCRHLTTHVDAMLWRYTLIQRQVYYDLQQMDHL